jgi:hypothetical protein
MSKKGSSQAYVEPEPVAAPMIDMSPMFEAFGAMSEMMMQTQASSTDAMMKMMAQAPQSTVTTEPDWKKRADELRAKITGDLTEEAAKRRGRESTILTSPLTEEEIKLTDSVLTGK